MAEFNYETGEHLLKSVRKHPLIFIGNLLPYAILAWLPTLLPELIAFIQNAGVGGGAWLEVITPANPWTRFVIGIYWLFTWMGAFHTFTDFYLDLWIITNHRIIRIDQSGFFDRQVSSLHLNRVQDVQTDVRGLLAELFGYGTLSVETAGDDAGRFRIRGIAHVKTLRDMIMKELTDRQEKMARISTSGVH
jgi:uncharacterized membrane protein YdbT with pleckstrin-like domain